MNEFEWWTFLNEPYARSSYKSIKNFKKENKKNWLYTVNLEEDIYRS